MSLFDTPRFNGALFFPRGDSSPAPAGANDLCFDVPGASLHVRRYAGPRRELLFFHGNGEVVADYDGLAPRFAELGVRLVVAEFRGYGRSTGTPTLRTALTDARALGEALQPALVMGRSLGGQCAVELAQRPAVERVVFESTATDLGALVRRRGLTERPSPRDHDDFDPLRRLSRCRARALFLHGEMDALISADEARAGHAVVPGSVLELVPRRGHNDLLADEAYWQALARFLS